jgi:hypothetical protein
MKRYLAAIATVLSIGLCATFGGVVLARGHHASPRPAPISNSVPPSVPTKAVGITVWVNTRSGIYHMPGARWYGNTENGQYMPEGQAIASGYRRSRRG